MRKHIVKTTFLLSTLLLFFIVIVLGCKPIEHKETLVSPVAEPPNNLPILPNDFSHKYDLNSGNNFEANWAFITPQKGVYFFSVTLEASEIRTYTVSLRTLSSSYFSRDSGYSATLSTQANTWEFYPIKGGQYHVLVRYNAEMQTYNSDFTLSNYSFRQINCQMLVLGSPHAYTSPNGNRLPEPVPISSGRNFFLHPDMMVTVIGVENVGGVKWYEILYPRIGAFSLEQDQTAWLKASDLLRDNRFSPDCQYFD